MAKPDWQNQNYKKANPVQKAAAGTLALGGLLAYGAKKAYDAFKNRKKDSDTSATTGIDISKDIEARNKPMPITPKQRKENQKAIKKIVDSQEVKYVENEQKPTKRIKNPYSYAPQKTTRKITRKELDEKLKKSNKQFDYQVKKNQQDSSNNNQSSSGSSSSSVEPPKEVKKNQTTTTKGKTRSDNRSRIIGDAASRAGKNSEQPKKKKPEMYSEYPRDVQARLKKIDKEIAKLMPTIKTATGSKKYKTLRAEKKDLLKNFKNKSIAENFGSP